MTRHVAFVRAIMIGREGLHRDVVLDLFRQAGAIEPRSHLATGNVSFDAHWRHTAGIVRHVEAGIEAIAGRPKPLYVRSVDHLLAMCQADPFREAPFGTSADGEVLFLPPRAPVATLPIVSASGSTSVFASNGTELFCVGRPVDGKPPDALGGVVERVLGVPVTVRAWSTIEKILAATT